MTMPRFPRRQFPRVAAPHGHRAVPRGARGTLARRHSTSRQRTASRRRVAARHHLSGPHLCRGSRDGGRPSRDGGHDHQPPHDGQSRAGRRLKRRRDRRHGRPGNGDDQALPVAARVLRKSRGPGALARRKSQPVVDDGARQLARGDVGLRRRATFRRLRPARGSRTSVGL